MDWQRHYSATTLVGVIDGHNHRDRCADALRTSEVMTLPIGAKTQLNLRNAHLSYAMTWYGIALALVGVYGAFHYQAGRLGFGGKAEG